MPSGTTFDVSSPLSGRGTIGPCSSRLSRKTNPHQKHYFQSNQRSGVVIIVASTITLQQMEISAAFLVKRIRLPENSILVQDLGLPHEAGCLKNPDRHVSRRMSLDKLRSPTSRVRMGCLPAETWRAWAFLNQSIKVGGCPHPFDPRT